MKGALRDLAGRLHGAVGRWAEALGRRERPGGQSRQRVFDMRAYPGSRTRRYELYLPSSYTGAKPLPLVMVLHGCHQDSSDIRSITDFDAIAEREGFIVVYPYVTGYAGIRMRDCWGWWLEHEIRAGAGEVEDLWQIVQELRAELRIDTRRVHVAGLSSGAGMAVAAMVARSGEIASGAVVAGVPYSETPRAIRVPGAPARFKPVDEVAQAMGAAMGQSARLVPIFIVHSSEDTLVDVQAAANIRDSWARCFDVDLTRGASHRTGVTGGMPWTHSRYRGEARQSVIETLLVDGGGHGWLGGNPGPYSFPDGPDASRLIWDFFDRHRYRARLREIAAR